jgi:hypothetical protein
MSVAKAYLKVLIISIVESFYELGLYTVMDFEDTIHRHVDHEFHGTFIEKKKYVCK